MTRLTTIASAALALTLFLPGSASADPFPIDCEVINADNITRGLADANGYSLISQISNGIVNHSSTFTITLPPDGIICIRRFDGETSGGQDNIRFIRNDANTPVYFLAEEYIDFGTVSVLKANGGIGTTHYRVGVTDLGGIGGPGGFDGGSCDTAVTTDRRAGEGHGPGGGKGTITVNEGGGGGSGPHRDGAAGYGTAVGNSSAAGGTAPSSFDHRMTRGGAGGGCGLDSGGNGVGGGGGGGVLIIAATNYIDTGGGTSAGAEVRGAGRDSTGWNGGGGGGGLIRLIAPLVFGSGFFDVRGSYDTDQTLPHNDTNSHSTFSSPSFIDCNNANYRGGCGGHGMLKIEAYDTGSRDQNGNLVSNGGDYIRTSTQAAGEESVKFGTPLPIFLSAANTPTVEITNINATFDSDNVDQTPAAVDYTDHVLKTATIGFRSSQVLTVTVHTEHVPTTGAPVFVRMNSVDPNPGAGTENLTVTAGSPVANGSGFDWTATITVPATAQVGTIEAWVANVCTPGVAGCP